MKTLIQKYAARAGVVALCSAALCTVPMMAQGGGGGGRGGMQQTSDQRVARLDTAVGPLTDDEKTKIKAIYDADAKKRADLANDPDMMTKMQAMRTDENKQIRALLTADQQTKFDAMPQGRGAGGGRGGAGGGAGAPPAAPPQ